MKNLLIILTFSVFCACKGGPSMPTFDVLLKDSVTILNTAQIPKGRPILLFYFSPDCEHCQIETKDILNSIESFRGARLYFITGDNFSRLKVYNSYYKLNNYKNIVLGQDFKRSLMTHYNILSPPFTIIYNKNKEVAALFAGQTSADEIVKQLNKVR